MLLHITSTKNIYVDNWLNVHTKKFHQMARRLFGDAIESFKVVVQILVKVQYNLWLLITEDQYLLSEMWTNAVDELLHHGWVFSDAPTSALFYLILLLAQNLLLFSPTSNQQTSN